VNVKCVQVIWKINVIRAIKSRRMSWEGYVARMGRGEVYTGFWWGNLREGDHFENPGVDGRIILIWMFRKWDVMAWTGLIWLRICNCGKEPSGFINCGEFLD
jgi:hypothetical protein